MTPVRSICPNGPVIEDGERLSSLDLPYLLVLRLPFFPGPSYLPRCPGALYLSGPVPRVESWSTGPCSPDTDRGTWLVPQLSGKNFQIHFIVRPL